MPKGKEVLGEMHLCVQGKHLWEDKTNAHYCCRGYTRVLALSRMDLAREGAKNICRASTTSQFWFGWIPCQNLIE